MTTGKIKFDPYATSHPTNEGTSYVPLNLYKSTVLTAKHCIEKSCKGKISYGSVNKKDPKYEILFDCGSSDVIKHSSSDLAIIRTKRTLDGSTALAIPAGPLSIYGEKVEHETFSVNESESPQPLQDVYPVGWGRACEDPGVTAITKHANLIPCRQVKVAPDDVCASKSYGPTMFCAGGMTGGMPKDACSGDSGGPVECMDRLGILWNYIIWTSNL
ncbi:platelet-aggregating proteinase PA-BJ-like [Symsagittifera roscoffensis]|uniref:platelet-aggregating proteinase PA-BJ-like n=1 Tax=Symsagittifera roscoffensis TaxID=84072 RepID=UPI00307CB7E3